MLTRIGRALIVGALLLWIGTLPLARATVVPPLPTDPTPQPTNPGPHVGDPPTVDTPEPATIISVVIGATAAGFYAWRRRSAAAE